MGNLSVGVTGSEVYHKGLYWALYYLSSMLMIKTSGDESRGQEEAEAHTFSGQCDYYSEIFTRMVDLNI